MCGKLPLKKMRGEYNEHTGHRDRMRRRFLENGLDSFHQHEALELLLYYARPRMDTNSVAHALIEKFGSLDKVFDAPLENLQSVEGIGFNTAVMLKLIPELGQYYVRLRFSNDNRFVNGNEIAAFLCSKLGLLKREVFAAIALDANYNGIAFSILYEGSFSSTEVDLRRLTEFVMKNGGDSVIIAHNHITNDPQPSQNDIDNTCAINAALKAVGIKLADHIIVSGQRYLSFSANNII